MKKFGLKQDYDFTEVRIFLPRRRTTKDIHDVLFLKVAPAIQELESMKLIHGFHFIVHEHIDLRISCNTKWTKRNIRYFQLLLSAHEIRDHLESWLGLDPKLYGGEAGVNLCYNNLEQNSRLVLAAIDANYTNTREPLKRHRKEDEQKIDNFFINQFQHFLHCQYGMSAEREIYTHLRVFKGRLQIMAREFSNLEAIKLGLRCFRRVFLERRRQR